VCEVHATGRCGCRCKVVGTSGSLRPKKIDALPTVLLAISTMRSRTVEPRTAKNKPTNSVCRSIGFDCSSGPDGRKAGGDSGTKSEDQGQGTYPTPEGGTCLQAAARRSRRVALQGGQISTATAWLRHTFAVVRLTDWYREGKNVQRLLPHLSIYLGHAQLRDTQRYLISQRNLSRNTQEPWRRSRSLPAVRKLSEEVGD
jgi:hypothetical protein